MSITKSIITSARPMALRGGRLRKRGGQVVSFAPHFSDLLSGASRVALGGVLILAGVAALSPSSAMALPSSDKCVGETTVICSGPANEDGEDLPITVVISDSAVTIETAAGFGIDSSEYADAAAITLASENDADIQFTDSNASSVTGAAGGIVATNNGDASTSISTNGAITTASGAAIVVTTSSTGDVTLTTAGTVSGNTGIYVAGQSNTDGIIAINNLGTITAEMDAAVTTDQIRPNNDYTRAEPTSNAVGVRAFNDGTGQVSVVNGVAAPVGGAAGNLSAAAPAPAKISAESTADVTLAITADLDDQNIPVASVATGIQALAARDASITVENHGVVTTDSSVDGTLSVTTALANNNRFSAEAYAIGIEARGEDGGAISITNTGLIESTATNNAAITIGAGEDISNNSGRTLAAAYAMMANAGGEGTITITNSGDVSATAANNSSFTLNGDTEGSSNYTSQFAGAIGIGARHSGSGDIVITNTGTVSATALQDSAASGTANIFVNRANVVAGINAQHTGTGNVSVTNTGDITVESIVADESYRGVFHFTIEGGAISVGHENEGSLTVTNTATITSNIDAIKAVHEGRGAITIDNTGIIDAGDEGIDVEHDGRGRVTITNAGTIDAGDHGIEVDHDGRGRVIISNTGTIIADDNGIDVEHEGRGRVIIENAGIITAEDDGIDVSHEGRGAINITNTGTINANDIGIDVRHDGRGSITITNAGNINAGDEGIEVYLDGQGDITVSNTGIIKSGYIGIEVDHDGDGNLTIDNAGAVTASYSYDIQQYTGEDRPSREYRIYGYAYAAGIDVSLNGDGQVSITNSAALTMSANVTGDLTFGQEAVPGSDPTELVENNVYTHADAVGISAYSGGEDNLTVFNEAAITANAVSNIAVSYTADEMVGNRVYTSAFAAGILANANDGGEVEVTNNASITVNASATASAAMNGGISAEQVVKANATAIGISAGQHGVGGIAITNSGSIKVSATANASMSLAVDGDYDSDVSWEANAIAIDAFHSGTGNIAITNTNTGSLTSADYGVRAGHEGLGNVELINNGTITGTRSAVSIMARGGNVSIANGGTLANASGNSDDIAIEIYADGYRSDETSFVTIVNDGVITGRISIGQDGINLDSIDLMDYTGVVSNEYITNNGTWNISGTSNFAGGEDVFVNNGVLNASDVWFRNLNSFQNHGTVSLANNVAGDSLSTSGSMLFAGDSNLILEISGLNVDRVYVDGDLSIQGGTLTINQIGPRALEGRYTLVWADTITGQFDDSNIANTAFLNMDLDYSDPSSIDLTIEKVADFSNFAVSPNHGSLSKALNSIPLGRQAIQLSADFEYISNAMIEELLYLPSSEDVTAAYNQLSGEAHASLRSNLADDSRLSRNAVLNRLQTREGSAIWGEFFYGAGNLDQAKNRSSNGSQRDASGFLIGVDAAVSDNVTLGLAASVVNHDNDQKLQGSNIESESVSLLAYVGAESGKARFKLGAGYAIGDVHTSRSIRFGNFNDRLIAHYDASVVQAFAELGYRLPLAGGYVEPMVNVVYVDTTTDGFTEKGGLAALTVAKASESTTLSTLGARFSTPQAGIFSLNGVVGWQHGFGNLTPSSIMAFAESDSFVIQGAPQSRDAAIAQVEAKFDVADTISIGVGYDGVLGNVSQDHAAKVSVRLKF